MIKEHIEEVKANIEAACKRAGRSSKEVTLIAVSKTKPVSMIREALDDGILDFGENKVQELTQKYEELSDSVRWHMIGHLQRNKVKQVIGKTVLIHSVDSIRLARQIELEASAKGIDVDILLEINVAGEESKFGFFPEEAKEAIREISKYTHVHIKGLMTVAPIVENPENNRSIFKKLYHFYVDMRGKNIDNVSMTTLSMGMTGDYEIAVEEGATMVRVGTGIFSARSKNGESEDEHFR